jgi:hypothetical protein
MGGIVGHPMDVEIAQFARIWNVTDEFFSSSVTLLMTNHTSQDAWIRPNISRDWTRTAE